MSISIYFLREDGILYIMAVGFSLTCEGGHFSCFPAAAAKIFGIKNGGHIYTIMFFANCISSYISFLMVYFGMGYKAIFTIAACLTASNMVLLYFFDDGPLPNLKKGF